nr:hypothetical protein [uncultured Ruegeria sp.]
MARRIIRLVCSSRYAKLYSVIWRIILFFGVFVDVMLIGSFLLIVFFYLLWHTRHAKRRREAQQRDPTDEWSAIGAPTQTSLGKNPPARADTPERSPAHFAPDGQS